LVSVVGALAFCATLALVLFLSDDRGRRPTSSPPSRARSGRTAQTREVAPARRVPTPAGRAALATIAAPLPGRLREPAFTDPPVPALEALELEAWRREQLVAAGVPPRKARRAAEAGVDAARVRALVERGCPPELALRIVA
jgi:hypothetical protein